MILANGLDYPAYPEWREPAATIVTRTSNKQPSRAPLATSVDKATWRELHALTVIAVDKTTNGGPVVLRNMQSNEDFDLWVGGLVAAGNGKLVDTTESVFHLPAAMLGETSQMVYEQGVRHSEAVESRLMRAVSLYHKQIGDNLDRPEMKDRRRQIQRHAASQFWTDTEQAVPRLLEVAAAPRSLASNRGWHTTSWGKTVWRAAREAYERACPHETPRQLQAYIEGLQKLFSAPPRAELVSPEAENEVEA
jgi:hypothetical protein